MYHIVRVLRKIISIWSLYYSTIYTSPLSLTGTVDAKADYPTDTRFLSQKPKRSPLQPIITACFHGRGLFSSQIKLSALRVDRWERKRLCHLG